MAHENAKDGTEKEPNAWCPMPWVGLSVRATGDIRFCCHANGSVGKGLLKNSSGEPLNLGTHSVAEAKNADLIKEVRSAMLDNRKHLSCMRCYSEEDSGMHSRRQAEAFAWQGSINEAQARKMTANDGSIDESSMPLRYLDLRFGNKCNLKCRMCGATESDQWYEGQVKIWNKNTFRDAGHEFEIVQNEAGQYKLKVDPYHWHESPKFLRDLDLYLPKMERIYFAGGEPLLIQSHFELLNKCIDLGIAKNVTLEYNTNITALTESTIALWRHFKVVEVGVSLDGIGAFNDYIRHPSKWSQVSKKIKMLDEADGNLIVWWAATIQVYNMLHLPDMMLWIIEQDFKRFNKTSVGVEILSPHPLHNPMLLSIKVFPEASKRFIKQVFEEKKIYAAAKIADSSALSDIEKKNLISRFAKILDTYCHFMMSEDLSDLRPKFWYYTNRLDEYHGTSLLSLCPKTFELMQ